MKAIKSILRFLAWCFGALILLSILLFQFDWFKEKIFGSRQEAGSDQIRKPEASCSVTICTSVSNLIPENNRRTFSFDEKIYAFADIKGMTPGRHKVTFRWINPQGKQQEIYQKDLYSFDGTYKCWSWIELQGELLPISLAPFGSGNFAGKWIVKTYLDGWLLAEADFDVR